MVLYDIHTCTMHTVVYMQCVSVIQLAVSKLIEDHYECKVYSIIILHIIMYILIEVLVYECIQTLSLGIIKTRSILCVQV